MANTSSTDVFDVHTQVFTLTGPDGITQFPVPVDVVDAVYSESFVLSINYGSQIGASFVMLLVFLLMTPRTKFTRTPTLINIAALVTNTIRCALLSWYRTSSFFEFYALWSGDYSAVPWGDYCTGVAATVFTIPVIILIEAALVHQAWAMIQLWRGIYKYTAAIISVFVMLLSIGFKFADSIIQAAVVLNGTGQVLWVRKTDLAFSTASICWLCFLFNIRLAMHMWTHRSILPSVKGMSAMEILVVTNGVLMLVPTIFSCLEYGTWTNFEFGSLTYTSVVVILPLGTLTAQRIANPALFNSTQNSKTHSSNSNKEPFLKSWHTTTDQSHGVSSRIVSERQNSLQDTSGFAKYGQCGDIEKGVRVDRQIEHREEMSL